MSALTPLADIPKPDKDAEEWTPGDKPSMEGFFAGFMKGFNFQKSEDKRREESAAEDAAQQRAEAEAYERWCAEAEACDAEEEAQKED